MVMLWAWVWTEAQVEAGWGIEHGAWSKWFCIRKIIDLDIIMDKVMDFGVNMVMNMVMVIFIILRTWNYNHVFSTCIIILQYILK